MRTVHLNEQLVEGVLALVVAAPEGARLRTKKYADAIREGEREAR